ncbi:sensor histidine kinase [Actinomadura rudentiformis]|uniref:histidine kinase n=1 Tax=Actinomadura rudentiformis TaxID=359158 RepID=A0A6H9Z1Y4_9ACTN|nr:sensor histidine kinase [Actinomadura rudentiformis]KAB2348276.1 sensor histidine kinase [Actinomadura rudentiformis]
MFAASRPLLPRRVPRRVPPRVRETLTWCLVLPYPVVMYAAMASGHNGFTSVEILAIVVSTAVAAGLLRRRPLFALALLLAGWSLALAVMQNVEVGYLELLITDLAVGFVAATRPPRVSLIAAAMALTTQTASAALLAPESTVIVLVTVAVVAVWAAGNSIRERRAHAEELAAQATDQAVTAERLRIARELHDMVAHSIGVIAIQAGVGNRVIDTQPAEARNALAAIEATSRETLTGLRGMLVALRRADSGAAPLAPTPGLADLDRLAATTLDAGVRVDVQRLGSPRPLPPDLDLSAFRIIQEAVTNVVRHADTPSCQVVVDYLDGALAIEITDDGPGRAAPGTGYGITGMRERVSLLNGHFAAGPRPEGGFRVAARLPA